MIEESYVSFDTARMLKEAGFDVECDWFYINDGSVDTGIVVRSTSTRDHNMTTGFSSRPTQALAARWLREEHHIFIMLTPVIEGWMYDLFDLKKHQYILCNEDAMTESYEVAFETALREAIKLIKK